MKNNNRREFLKKRKLFHNADSDHKMAPFFFNREQV